MSTIAQLSLKQVKRILKDNGFSILRITGSHLIFARDGKHISIPHKSDPNKMLVRRVFKENNIIVS